jgi:hypothetical protein
MKIKNWFECPEQSKKEAGGSSFCPKVWYKYDPFTYKFLPFTYKLLYMQCSGCTFAPIDALNY